MTTGIDPIGELSEKSYQSNVDPNIQAVLKQLGIQSTGTTDGDISEIQSMLKAEQTKKSEAASLMQNSQDASLKVQISSLLAELGISSTGNMTDDLAAISSKISTMSSQATSEADKAKVASLQSSYQAIADQMNTNSISSSLDNLSNMNMQFHNLSS